MADNWLVVGGNTGGGGGGGGSQANFWGCFLGDSLTLGSFLNPEAPAGSYPGQVQSQIGGSIANLGVNGATTTAIIASVQLSQAQALFKAGSANIAFVMAGTNDGIFGVPAATTIANLTTIVSTLQGYGYKVVIGTITPSNYVGNPPGYQTFRTTVNNAILAGTTGADVVFNAGNDPRIADLTSAPFSTFPSNLYQTDDLHFKQPGYQIIAQNAAAAAQVLLNSEFAFSLVSPSGVPLTGSYPQPANVKTSEWISVNDFGARSTQSADINTLAITTAITAASLLGKSVRFPEANYNVHKFNIWQASGGKAIKLWSDTISTSARGPGTVLTCDGTGTSWLKGVVNCVAPNGGNTGPDLSSAMYGLVIEGIYCQQTSGLGVGSLKGIWIATCFNSTIRDSGVLVPPASGRWSDGIATWQCGIGTEIINPSVDTCSAGISTNGNVSDPLTNYSDSIQIVNPKIQNCTSAGISFAFSNDCRVLGGFTNNCAVAFYGNGKNNTWDGGEFIASGTADVDMLTATAPWGPTVKPDGQKLIACEFSGAVNLRNSTGTALVANAFGAGSSLLIDSNCIATNLLQHNSFPATAFVDNGVATYLASAQVGSTNPTTLPGIAGQYYYYTTPGVLYICTVSGLGGAATWVSVSAPSRLNLSYRAVSTSTVAILTTDFMVATTFASAGNVTVNLPQANTCAGLVVSITNFDTNAASLDNITAFAGDHIQQILTVLPLSQYASTMLMSDGVSNWVIVALSISPVQGTGINIAQTGTNFKISTDGTQTATFRTVTTPTATFASTDYMIATNHVGGCSLTLPLAATAGAGKVYVATNYNSDTSLSGVGPGGSDTINKVASVVAISYLGCDTFMSDGVSNWVLVNFQTQIFPSTGISVGIVGNQVTIGNTGVLSVGGALPITSTGGSNPSIGFSNPWSTWSPTLTTTNQTLGSSSVTVARWVLLGNRATFEFQANYTISAGGSVVSFNFTLPNNAHDLGGAFACSIFASTGLTNTGCIKASASTAALGLLTSTNTTYTVWVTGEYEI